MKSALFALLLVLAFSCTSFAATALVNEDTGAPIVSEFTPGWGPGVVGSFGKFSLNGNYSLVNGGIFVGPTYTWNQATNVNSAGFYIGPQSTLQNGVTTTTLDAMIYVALYKTSAGSFGAGFDWTMWQSGKGINPINQNTTAFTLGYKF
jgi:hypothetical protein